MSKRSLSLADRVINRYKTDGFRGLAERVRNRLMLNLNSAQLLAVAVELTNYCNLRCGFCFVDKTRKQGFMSSDLFKKVVDEAAELQVHNLAMNYGGESLCHPRFKEFLKYAVANRHEKGVKWIGWVDNGMLFSHDIADLVVELGVDDVGFSLEGFAPVNDKERTGCSYEKVRDNILYLIERRGKRKKPVVYIDTLNPASDMDFIRYWMRHADIVSWSAVRDRDNRLLHPEFFSNTRQVKKCLFPWFYLGVFWNGAVTACCSDGDGKMNLGDANVQSLREIWFSSAFKRLRRQYDSSLCQKCNFWRYEFAPAEELVFGGEGELFFSQYWKRYRKVQRK